MVAFFLALKASAVRCYIVRIVSMCCGSGVRIFFGGNRFLQSSCIKAIDMRRFSRPPPPLPFPLCAGRVPFELVVSAALLGRENYGEGGQIVFQMFTTTI
jgi:hypothetical protein